jgi:peptide chain release factor 2
LRGYILKNSKQMPIFQQDIDKLIAKFHNYLDTFDIKIIQANIIDLEIKLADELIWQDHAQATSLQKDLDKNKKTEEMYSQLINWVEELKIAGELNEEALVEGTFRNAAIYLEEIEKKLYLNGKYDAQNALLTIHAGAGGIDAEDWAAMLMSMYQACSKEQNWKVTIVDLSAGLEGGIKTASLKIEGDDIYGLLKEEFGVHRLVRLSPFNSAHTRETSFALVEVMPLEVEEFKFVINESDLKWDYFMAGGHGGQSVNTTYSAVRVTHLPTKTVVTCQNERSQVQNKAMALKYLQTKLALQEAEKNQENKKELRGSWQSASWGNQIRSYVSHPYKLVKDLRSNWETSDIDNVLVKGDILPIIWSVKRAITKD